MEKLLNIHEVSGVLGLKKVTLYEWVEEGKIPYVKLGKRVLFHPKDIEDFINKNRVELPR